MRVDLVQSVVVFGAELVLKVCSGYSLSQNEPVPLAGQGFLHRWILLDPVTPSVGTDVVASSPMMLCMLECLGISFLWVLWDWVQSQSPKSAQGTSSDWKEPMPLGAVLYAEGMTASGPATVPLELKTPPALSLCLPLTFLLSHLP